MFHVIKDMLPGFRTVEGVRTGSITGDGIFIQKSILQLPFEVIRISSVPVGEVDIVVDVAEYVFLD